jgi:GYF domain 2
MTWHVVRNGQRWGPISFDDLQRAAIDGRLRPDDQLWEPGMVNWHPASQVSWLWGLPPPPLPQEAGPQPAGGAGHKKKRYNLIAAHWQGEFSLGVAYWGIGFLLTLVTLALFNMLGDSFPHRGTQRVARLYLVGFIVFSFCFASWQLVGIWRSANNHTKRGGRVIWAALAKLAVILNVVPLGIESYTLMGPVIGEGVKLAVGIEDIPNHQFRLLDAKVALPNPVVDALAVLPDPGPTPDEKKLLELEQERKAEEARKQALEEELEQERKAAEEARKQALEEKLEQERKAAEEARKQALEEKLEQERKATEEARKQAELIRKAAKAKKKQFDAQRVADLPNKVPDKSLPPARAATRAAPTAAKGAVAGAPEARDSQPADNQPSLLSALMNLFKSFD